MFELASPVPLISAIGAAPDMGNGIYESAVDQTETVGGEGGRDAHAVRAIAVKKQRRLAVDRGVAPTQDRYRDIDAAVTDRVEAVSDVVVGFVTARDFLFLAQHPVARRHIEIERPLWRRQ